MSQTSSLSMPRRAWADCGWARGPALKIRRQTGTTKPGLPRRPRRCGAGRQLGLDLAEVRDVREQPGHALHECEPVAPQRRVIRHDEDLVEEPVHRGLELRDRPEDGRVVAASA